MESNWPFNEDFEAVVLEPFAYFLHFMCRSFVVGLFDDEDGVWSTVIPFDYGSAFQSEGITVCPRDFGTVDESIFEFCAECGIVGLGEMSGVGKIGVETRGFVDKVGVAADDSSSMEMSREGVERGFEHLGKRFRNGAFRKVL